MPMKANDALNYAKQLLKDGRGVIQVRSFNHGKTEDSWLIELKENGEYATIRERPKKGKK